MTRAISWTRVGDRDQGLEHLLLGETSADGVVLAFDEHGRPFRLGYQLTWDASWRVRDARLVLLGEASHGTRVIGQREVGSFVTGTERKRRGCSTEHRLTLRLSPLPPRFRRTRRTRGA